ncbi:hypothetical protein JCM10207_001470 [Rhodosporidiobolus poonsookiae]
MPHTLPIEVQLIVLEFAIASLDAHTFESCQDNLNSFSLVHRSWTKMAQQELFQTLALNLSKWVDPVEVVKTRLDIAQRRGIVVQSLNLAALPTSQDRRSVEGEAFVKLATRLKNLDCLKLQLNCAAGPVVSCFKNLARLHYVFCGVPRDVWHTNFLLPISLTHLHVEATELYTLSLLPNLTSLVLGPGSTIHRRAMSALPSLRIFKWDMTLPPYKPDCLDALQALEELQVVFGEKTTIDATLRKLTSSFPTRSPFSSLEVYISAGLLVPYLTMSDLQRWCQLKKVDLVVVRNFNLTCPVDPFLRPHARNDKAVQT